MHLLRKNILSALIATAGVAVLVSCGGGSSSGSDTTTPDQGSASSTQYSSPQPSSEDPGNAGDTLGNLILLSDETDNNYLDDIGTTCVVTFIDTDTGQSSSRTFTLREGGDINPGEDECLSSRLPFNADLTKLAVVSDQRDPSSYYLSAGYVEANGNYVEVATAESSFGGEGGYYAATFQDDLLLVLTKNNEWVDPVSQEVKFPGPKGLDDWDRLSLYLSGSTPTDYGSDSSSPSYVGCRFPSRLSNKCYSSNSYGDIRVNGKTIRGKEDCLLLTVDSKDNFYCVNELSDGQKQLVRIDRSTGELRTLTPETDQEILQAVVSSNEQQVLFTARREGDPITAYAVSAAGESKPRELSVLTGELSEEDELYSWTATQ